jgi:hypothetical protein
LFPTAHKLRKIGSTHFEEHCKKKRVFQQCKVRESTPEYPTPSYAHRLWGIDCFQYFTYLALKAVLN